MNFLSENGLRPSRNRIRAFSLVEMLAVMAILAIMLTLLMPAINSFNSTAGRKGAVSVLMNTLEQARGAALSSGADVYVLLWRRQYPDPDALMVVREPLDWNLKPDGTQESALVPLSRWIPLPKGVLLHDPSKGANVFKAGVPGTLKSRIEAEVPKLAGKSPSGENLGVVWFRNTGAIQQPLDKQARIIVTEGIRGEGNSEAVISQRKQSQGVGGGFDVISLSRFTGRPQLDVTVIN